MATQASEAAAGAAQHDLLLEVDGLCVTLFTDAGELKCIQDLSFVMRRGETLAVVGESGCGKSMTALSIMDLIPKPPAKIVGGQIRFEGTDLVSLSPDRMRDYRGNKISMIFQEPMTSLNPVMLSGVQIAEGLLVHNRSMSKQEANERALEMIKFVGIPAPEKVFKSYPFELSGGMRQRIMIAMALACNPALLICDEPTTALDVTIQAQVLQLIDEMREKTGTAVMLITHDMGVVSEMADWVLVMYAGRQVEYTTASELFSKPAHPYTQGLIDSIPTMEGEGGELYAIPGNVPMLNELPTGCLFNPRCPYAKGICKRAYPQFVPVNGNQDHQVACWRYTEQWDKEAS